MHKGDRPSPSKLLLLDMHCETKCQQRIHGGYESIAVNGFDKQSSQNAKEPQHYDFRLFHS